MTGPSKAEAFTAFDRAIEASLTRQAARAPREAAKAACGPRASEADLDGWLRAHRPDAVSEAS